MDKLTLSERLTSLTKSVEFNVLSVKPISDENGNCVELTIVPILGREASIEWGLQDATKLVVYSCQSDIDAGRISKKVYYPSLARVNLDVFEALWGSAISGASYCVQINIFFEADNNNYNGFEWIGGFLEIKNVSFVFDSRKKHFHIRSMRLIPSVYKETSNEFLSEFEGRIDNQNSFVTNFIDRYRQSLCKAVSYCMNNAISERDEYEYVLREVKSVIIGIYRAVWNDDKINPYHDAGLKPVLWYNQVDHDYHDLRIKYDMKPDLGQLEDAVSRYLSCSWMASNELDYILIDALMYAKLKELRVERSYYSEKHSKSKNKSSLFVFLVSSIACALFFYFGEVDAAILSLLVYVVWRGNNVTKGCSIEVASSADIIDFEYAEELYRSKGSYISPRQLSERLINSEEKGINWPSSIYTILDRAESDKRVVGYTADRIDYD